MEMLLRSHAWARRAPDWVAAVVAGLAASAVLMVLELLWSASLGERGTWDVSRRVAALVMGTGVLEGSGFALGPVALALLTHYALGVFSGVAVGVLIAGFNWEHSLGVMLGIGAAFGSVIYFVNFHALGPWFPWFAELRGWAAYIGHLVFGMSASLIYFKLNRHAPSEPAQDH